jgi:hypothetical protein
MRGVPEQGNASLRPLFERWTIANFPALQVITRCPLDE